MFNRLLEQYVFVLLLVLPIQDPAKGVEGIICLDEFNDGNYDRLPLSNSLILTASIIMMVLIGRRRKSQGGIKIE